MNVCSSVQTDELSNYPINQSNIANKLLNKELSMLSLIIGNLVKKLAIFLPKNFYDYIKKGKQLSIPNELSLEPASSYGGYMVWEFKNGKKERIKIINEIINKNKFDKNSLLFHTKPTEEVVFPISQKDKRIIKKLKAAVENIVCAGIAANKLDI